MQVSRMIPFIWIRLVVLIFFTIFVAWKSMWLITAIAVGLIAWTAFQLYYIYSRSS